MVIMYFVYSERTKSNTISQKISNLKMDCPSCPDMKCPESVCPENKDCPKCPKCPKQSCPSCPKCPDCPNTDYPTVDDIISGIFPGRDPSVRFGGNYFPTDSVTESCPTTGMPYNNTVPSGGVNQSEISSSVNPPPSLMDNRKSQTPPKLGESTQVPPQTGYTRPQTTSS